jgi:formate hydrogenlyase transcriptional activator
MEKNNAATDALLKNLQEREREQSLVFSVCALLAPVTNNVAFSQIIGQRLKDLLNFDDLVICTADLQEQHYSIFYQCSDNTLNRQNNTPYNVADGIFDRSIAAADNTAFELSQLSKKQLPDYILKAQGLGIRYLISVPLPYQKNMPAVVFLLYKRPNGLDRQGARLLKGIGTQLSITSLNIANAQKWERLNAEMALLRQRPEEKLVESVKTEITEDNFHGIIGKSEIMEHIFDLIKQVAYTDTNVLIMGETGTGKEVVAQAIHRTSTVKNKIMVRVNCAAIPANLIESELFGHEKGSFTGATEKRLGKFELANNSTIFLDEIGELPLELQAKMLRVLQEREIERIGASGSIKVNVRVIAATNRDLLKEVAEGRFRSDLYYRLNVYPIAIPALRDRMEDLPLLSTYFLKFHAEKTGKKVIKFSQKAIASMTAYQWPGNVRELSNIIERSILYTKGDIVNEIQFPHTEALTSISNQDKYSTKTLQQVEKEHILSVIKQCKGRISGPNGAAVLLGVPSTTLISKMQKLGIKKGHTV